MFRFSIFRDFLIIAIIVISMLMYHGYYRDLPPPVSIDAAESEVLAPIAKRRVEHFVLHTASLGDIGFAASFPDPMPQDKKLPIVMVLGGLDTGEHNISQIGAAGDNVIVGYDWPMSVTPPNDLTFLMHTPEFYSRSMGAPGQIASAIDWIANQQWADDSRISILGYSMGALAAPAVQEETQLTGRLIRWTIIAYGGAPLEDILVSDRHVQPSWMRYALAPFVKVLFHPLEPTIHLPHMTGNFLILEGRDDSLMPEAARATLRNAVPEPKTVITFDGEHMGMGPEKAELMRKIIDASRDWLVRTNAVNPL